MLMQAHKYNHYEYSEDSNPYSSIPELIEEIKNGRIVVIHDETTGYGFLLGAAQMATPAMINFMACHGRGVICLALTQQRISELALPLMADTPVQQDRQAYAVSIEARHGVTTGISAADRARTIATAIYTSDASVEIVTPGHVFPLRASDGGVLARAGHAEAAIDLPRLAGMNPSGVICGVINDEGDNARLDDLMVLAHELDLKIGSIQDMILFRQEQDRFIHCSAETSFESDQSGTWTVKIFTSDIDQSETVMLQKGEVGFGRDIPLDLRPFSLLAGLFAGAGGDNSLLHAMNKISEHGAGIIILTVNSAPGTLANDLRQQAVGERLHQHNFGNTAQILAELDVRSVRLVLPCDITAAKLRQHSIIVTK